MREADERLARMHVSAAVEPGQPVLLEAVRCHGATTIVDVLTRGGSVLDRDGRHGRRLAAVDPQAVADAGQRLGLSFVIPGDAGWPALLDDLAGVVRDGRGGVPVGLWTRGHLDPATLDRSAAVVGSRAATVYGTTVATDWAAALVDAGVVVVSGAAYGIDAAAHRGALAADGPTVAVLAGGVDQPYPRGNAALIERIADEGLLVSEAAPGSTVNRGRFLGRNRLIAALARGTVVVEAGARSGALSSAGWAQQLHRVVAAVPGPVTSAMSVGVHHLLREQHAVLVSRPAEVVELIGRLGADCAELPLRPDAPTDGLSERGFLVHESLPARGTVTVAELMVATGLGVSPVLRALAELAERGLADGASDVWRRCSPRRPVP